MMDWSTIGLSVAGLVIANYGIKFGRAYPLIKKGYELIKEVKDAKADGVLTDEEKIDLYDKIEAVFNEAWSIIKGWFPNKSE